MSILLAGGTVVVALDPPSVEVADVLIDGDRIAAVGRDAGGVRAGAAGSTSGPVARTAGPAVERVDCGGCLVLPGNVCAHTHAYSALARGMPYRLDPPRDFVEILRRVWWRLDRALDEASIRASARVAAMEALLAGTTTLVDHHASPNAIDGSLDVIAEAFAEIGVRSILAYEVTDRDGDERARAGLAENVRFLRSAAAGKTPLARGMVGAHASFTLGDETLGACVEAARAEGVGIHVHAAEDAADEEESVTRHGRRVAARLAEAGALDERTLLAHGVHLDPFEVSLVRRAGATVAHNARSNMNNRVGRAPVAELGSRVALGTDGIGADMFEESRTAWLRLRDGGGDPPPAWPLARLADGAAFAGRAFGEPRLGIVERGAPADIVVLDQPLPTPVEAATLAGHWTFGLSARAVRDVVVAGRLVVRDRTLTGADAREIAADARAVSERLWARLDGIAEHPFALREVAGR